jgi:putative ABC transport system permease protein
MGVLKFKIWRDLWGQFGRTVQVVLIIGIAAGAIGMIRSTRNLVISEMNQMWREINPAMINLFIGPPIDEDELIVLEHVDGVAVMEPASNATIEWRLNEGDEWKQASLNTRPDYEHQKLNMLDLWEGNWPSGKVVDTGQDGKTTFRIPIGGQVEFRIDEKIYKVHVGGVVYDSLATPALFGGTAQFFASQEFYEYLTDSSDYNQLMITAPQWDEDAVTELADRLQAKLKKQGKDSYRYITNPNEHFFQSTMDGIFLVTQTLGIVALLLGLLLVYNTINAVISQQVDQIGVMKAIGARTWHIVRLYLVTVLAYGVLAFLIALPLGVGGGWLITSALVGSFGADPGSFEYDRQAIIILATISLLAPLLVSLIPIFLASRTTVREAISTYGLSTGAGLIERVLAKMRYISRLTIITISNTFRHKWRAILMQIALVVSGLAYMMVASIQDSVNYTIRDVLFGILNVDVTMVFEEPQRIDYLTKLTMEFPGIQSTEMWGLAGVTMRPAGEAYSEDDENATIFGVPLPTELYGYQLREGRWLNPDDTYAIVMNQKLAEDVGVDVGDWVTARYEENQERDWQVVGLVFDPVLTNTANAPRDVLLHDIGAVDKVFAVWIKTQTRDAKEQIALAKNLRQYYKDHHVKVSPQHGVFGGMGGDATVETADAFVGQFKPIVGLLQSMILVIGIVGAIALSGAVSLSVLERSREIGVLRAIGASSWTIARLFIGESLIQGWLSWLIALPLSIPFGWIMVKGLGAALELDIVFHYTTSGAMSWFIIITILAILASLIPVFRAMRISVRENLAYQ